MKITFLIPMVNLAGGIRSTFELANHLTDRGHEISVVYPLIPPSSGKKAYNFRSLGNRFIESLKNIKKGKDVQWFDLKANLIRVPTFSERWIPEGDVLVATWWENAYHVHQYNQKKVAKFYFIRHYETWGGPPELVKKSYNLPLNKIVTSNWLKELIESKFNVSVDGPIPNAVNYIDFYRKKNRVIPHKPVKVGMLYRSPGFKCMGDGITAIKMIKERYPSVKIVLFGEPLTKQHREEIKDLNYEFHLLPFKEKLLEIYNSIDIFLFSSCSEGYGNPPMEAMACGCAVVSTDVGAIPDYSVNGQTILTSSPNDPTALTDNVIKLLENKDLMMKIAQEGHSYIQKYSWENSAKKLEKIFEEFIN